MDLLDNPDINESTFLPHAVEDVYEDKEKSDEERHPARHHLRLDEEADPAGHHEHEAWQINLNIEWRQELIQYDFFMIIVTWI